MSQPSLPPNAVVEPACAKINLTLHVTGKRADGYHLLESFVAFSSVHDTIIAEPDADLTEPSLRLIGPMAEGLSAEADNIVLRAARALGEAAAVRPGVRLTLVKRLPVSSGIGGGSADAAATLRALSRLWRTSLPPKDMHALALGLGADVPVCLLGKAVTMSGVGEVLTPAPGLPSAGLLLVNPLKPVSTPAVFKARTGPFSPADPVTESSSSAATLAESLKRRANDLAAPAQAIVPEIAQVLDALAVLPGCLLSRMSGSGATCFALFESETVANEAALTLNATRSDWWIAPSRLVDDTSGVSAAF